MAAHCTHQASLLSDEVDEDEVPPHYVYNYDNTTQKMSMRPLSNYTEHIRNFRKPSFLRSVIPDFECSGQGISGSAPGESENSRSGVGRSQETGLPSTTTGNDVHIITDASASSNLLAQFMNQGASSSEEEQGVNLPDAAEDDEDEKLRMTEKELAALHAREEEELIMRLKAIPADSSNSEPGSGNEGHDHSDAADHSTARSSTSTSVPQFSQSLGRAQYPYPRSSSAAKDKEDTTGTGEPREPGMSTSTAMGKKKTTRRTKKKPQQTAQQRDSLRANLAEKQCEGLLLKIRRQTELGERVDAFQVIDKVRRICESAQLKSETEKKLMKRILPMVETVVAPSPAETGLLALGQLMEKPASNWRMWGCDLDAQFDARTEIEDTEVQSADRPRREDRKTTSSSSSRNKPARTQATRQHFMPEELDLGSERPGKMHMQCLSKKALKKEEQKKLARKAQREKRLEKATSPARTVTSGRAAPGSSPPTKPKAKGRSSEPTVAVASSSGANDDANAALAAPKPTVMETREQLAPAVADAGSDTGEGDHGVSSSEHEHDYQPVGKGGRHTPRQTTATQKYQGQLEESAHNLTDLSTINDVAQ
eukprot:g5202.t1